MNNYNFKSILRDELYNFIEYKKSLGYKYNYSYTICKKIDMYWDNLSLKKVELLEEDVINFAHRNDNESINYYRSRLYILKHFALFLIQRGYKNIYVYDFPIKQKKYQYVPYIYTEKDFIKFIHKLNVSKNINKDKYIIIFKLLYCTGLRLSEATHIQFKDVDLSQGTIMITNGKNCNIRLIALSNSILKIIKDYLNGQYKNNDDYIFSTKNNTFIQNCQLEQVFRKINDECKIGKNSINRPRIHDFRHGFAIKTLDRMYEKGYDYYTTLPLLAKFMGHSDIKHTEYYLRLTKYYHSKVIEKEIEYCNIIPEVNNDK